MALSLYPSIYASGSVPQEWAPARGGAVKYPVRNRAVHTMKSENPFPIAFSEATDNPTQQLEWFALLNLGLLHSLATGTLSATEAIERFYRADNCRYVRRHLRDREANAIMSHGVQLPDLFDYLPAEEARREFYRELETMRALCLKLLQKRRPRSFAKRATA